MKLAQGLKVIGKGWVVKPKGFRVRYQKRVDSKIVTEYSPRLEDAALFQQRQGSVETGIQFCG